MKINIPIEEKVNKKEINKFIKESKRIRNIPKPPKIIKVYNPMIIFYMGIVSVISFIALIWTDEELILFILFSIIFMASFIFFTYLTVMRHKNE